MLSATTDPPPYYTRFRANAMQRATQVLAESSDFSDHEVDNDGGASIPDSTPRPARIGFRPLTAHERRLSGRAEFPSDISSEDPPHEDMSEPDEYMFRSRDLEVVSPAWGRANDRSTLEREDLKRTLNEADAIAVVRYQRSKPSPTANDIWPNRRDSSKLPARYQPLSKDGSTPAIVQGNEILLQSTDSQHIGASGLESFRGRPTWSLPVELLELIADYLSREDVKAMRLVSRELNSLVSQVIFKTVVVPFNTEIYGMLERDPRQDLKGKKRARLEKTVYAWQNSNDLDVYNGHGLDVFKGFGRHIQKFGMSFEVSEDYLANPPIKIPTAKQTSFWGDYEWPYEKYQRFAAVAGLETAADETPRMKVAFSELSKVRELALSIDNGLGWLNGPDRSIRARILQSPPKVFGIPKDIPDRHTEAQEQLWQYIERCHQDASKDVKHATLCRIDGCRSTQSGPGPTMPYMDQRLINEAIPASLGEEDPDVPVNFQDPVTLNHFILPPIKSDNGLLFTSTTLTGNNNQIMSPIIPAALTKFQKEWLLETDWAQRAFTASYMLSIIDNPLTFLDVHSLTISRVSDCYLTMLNRPDFWDALPSLSHLTLMVIPSWRTVYKDEAGFVETPMINPTSSLTDYCELLQKQISPRANIRNLVIGWTNGGEHAEGLYARNKNLMPAPIMESTFKDNETMTETDTTRLEAAMLRLPFVESITLSNCWITPAALSTFVKVHDSYCLKHLIFDSISLTAVLRPAGNAIQQLGVLPPGIPAPVGQHPGAGGFWNLLNVALAAHPVHQHPHALAQNNHNQVLQLVIQTGMAHLQVLAGNATTVQQQNQITALQNQLQHLSQQIQTQNPMQAQTPTQVQQAQAQNQHLLPQHANVGAMINHAQLLSQQIAAQTAAAANQALPTPAAPAPATTAPNPQTVITYAPRNGSWLNIIDIISPGQNLSDLNSTHSQADPERTTSLRSIEFISCGYARLPHATNIDQSAIDPGPFLTTELRDPVFTRRAAALAPAMMPSKWPQLGEVIQHVDFAELQALDVGWDLQTGWDDAEEARSVEFDGCLAGGNGRFTGIIRAEDRYRTADDEYKSNEDGDGMWIGSSR